MDNSGGGQLLLYPGGGRWFLYLFGRYVDIRCCDAWWSMSWNGRHIRTVHVRRYVLGSTGIVVCNNWSNCGQSDMYGKYMVVHGWGDGRLSLFCSRNSVGFDVLRWRIHDMGHASGECTLRQSRISRGGLYLFGWILDDLRRCCNWNRLHRLGFHVGRPYL